jgi:hypothetical protein
MHTTAGPTWYQRSRLCSCQHLFAHLCCTSGSHSHGLIKHPLHLRCIATKPQDKGRREFSTGSGVLSPPEGCHAICSLPGSVHLTGYPVRNLLSFPLTRIRAQANSAMLCVLAKPFVHAFINKCMVELQSCIEHLPVRLSR